MKEGGETGIHCRRNSIKKKKKKKKEERKAEVKEETLL